MSKNIVVKKIVTLDIETMLMSLAEMRAYTMRQIENAIIFGVDPAYQKPWWEEPV